MRIAFAGTPEFARVVLQALLAAGRDVALVFAQPDRPAGRGMKLQACAVKQLAQHSGIAVVQPRGLRLDGRWAQDAAGARAALEAARVDVMVVAAYGLMLPQWVLEMPPLGCINVHASLLPRWRGAAPIARAIEAGDTQTGVSIMQMDAGLDTGDVLLAQPLPIAPHDTAASLHDKLAQLGGELLVQTLDVAQRGALHARAQPQQGVSYAHKIDKAQGRMDWRQDAAALQRRVRAWQPFPVAFCFAPGSDAPLKVWQAVCAPQPAPAHSVPGQVLALDAQGMHVACGQGTVLCVQQVQRAGARRMSVQDWLRGFALPPGAVLT